MYMNLKKISIEKNQFTDEIKMKIIKILFTTIKRKSSHIRFHHCLRDLVLFSDACKNV